MNVQSGCMPMDGRMRLAGLCVRVCRVVKRRVVDLPTGIVMQCCATITLDAHPDGFAYYDVLPSGRISYTCVPLSAALGDGEADASP